MTASHSTPRPFTTSPDPSRYFPAGAMEEARQRIGRSVQRGEGPVLVIGATGLGKTMLLEVVAQQFRDQLQPVLLMGGQLCTRRALLQMLLFQLRLPYRDMDESELRLALLSYLQPRGATAQQILVLVDEADSLPPRLLEELRAMTNLSSGGLSQVNMVLAGNSTLEEQFADPKLDLFSQRISARCYLSAFGREETFQYVRAQVAAAGADPQSLFTDDGLEAIFAATDGVPRLINQLGDQLLWMVSETGYAPLDGQIVQQAWSELQQLPAPWNTQANDPQSHDPQSHDTVAAAIEFGELPSDEIVLEEIAFEDDSYDDSVESNYAADFDDDMPASIPLHAPQPPIETPPAETPAVDFTSDETIDVTEQLLEQLHIMDSAEQLLETAEVEIVETPQHQPQPQQHLRAEPEEPARNPFSETFESEEIVLDQYSTFESLLLAEAPRVVNGSDTSFAEQLQQLESVEILSPNLAAASVADPAPDSEPDSEPIVLVDLDEPSDVLIIEENDTPGTTIVEGQKFRQLFSSLEAENTEPCFG